MMLSMFTATHSGPVTHVSSCDANAGRVIVNTGVPGLTLPERQRADPP